MKRKHQIAEAAEAFELEIQKLVYGGEGLGRHEGKVVFVPFTVPGDRVLVRPIEHRKDFIRAVVERVLQPGPGRCEPPCSYFGRCGGCQWQHIEYTLQAETKRKILEEGFHHRFPETRSLPISIKACPSPYGYRSRARLQLRGTGEQAVAGFFRLRSSSVEDVSSCPLLMPVLNEALTSVRTSLREGHLDTGATEVELACAADGRWDFDVAGRVQSPAGEKERDALLKQVGGFVYATESSVFFQANDFMLAELIETALAQAKGGTAALDLFTGVGFFTLPLASHYRSVTAVESDPKAHRLAIRNAAAAQLGNIQTACAGVLEWMKTTAGALAPPAFDLILLDPPRIGAGPEVMRCLTEWTPETIIYVSCDPQTLLRDLAVLPERDYRIDSIAGLDLFPQTYHIETVVTLRRR